MEAAIARRAANKSATGGAFVKLAINEPAPLATQGLRPNRRIARAHIDIKPSAAIRVHRALRRVFKQAVMQLFMAGRQSAAIPYLTREIAHGQAIGEDLQHRRILCAEAFMRQVNRRRANRIGPRAIKFHAAHVDEIDGSQRPCIEARPSMRVAVHCLGYSVIRAAGRIEAGELIPARSARQEAQVLARIKIHALPVVGIGNVGECAGRVPQVILFVVPANARDPDSIGIGDCGLARDLVVRRSIANRAALLEGDCPVSIRHQAPIPAVSIDSAEAWMRSHKACVSNRVRDVGSSPLPCCIIS